MRWNFEGLGYSNPAPKFKRNFKMNLQDFLEKVGGKESDIVVFATESEALKAVESDGNALRCVNKKVFSQK